MPPFLLDRRDIIGGLFVAALLAVLIAAYVVAPTLVAKLGPGTNFGPDWDCSYTPKSEPVCVKRVPRKAAD